MCFRLSVSTNHNECHAYFCTLYAFRDSDHSLITNFFVIKNVCGELRVSINIILCFLVVCGSVHDYNCIDCLGVCFVRVYYMWWFIR